MLGGLVLLLIGVVGLVWVFGGFDNLQTILQSTRGSA